MDFTKRGAESAQPQAMEKFHNTGNVHVSVTTEHDNEEANFDMDVESALDNDEVQLDSFEHKRMARGGHGLP
jgi:hypothetical protein